MKYTVVVFNSRNDTMRFYKIIQNYGLFCSVINTPRPLSRSCGVSVKIDNRLVSQSINIIRANRFTSYHGIYLIEIVGGSERVNKLA